MVRTSATVSGCVALWVRPACVAHITRECWDVVVLGNTKTLFLPIGDVVFLIVIVGCAHLMFILLIVAM
jgi:hypothetical protein